MYKFMSFIYNSIKGVKKMRKNYTIIVHKEENQYWAECKEIKGCFAQAKTIEELKKLMIKNIYLYYSEDKEECKEIDNIELELSYA